jgi:hypothetical protein
VWLKLHLENTTGFHRGWLGWRTLPQVTQLSAGPHACSFGKPRRLCECGPQNCTVRPVGAEVSVSLSDAAIMTVSAPTDE